ncbi:hypothetical protein OHU34_41300 [Streptomyces sp. NBC_00080]|uniref:hypothetical protein n=1 Tax=Streptomyces sp. NBC_00080 TaxID=2975645 RepID=UPI003246E5D6
MSDTSADILPSHPLRRSRPDAIPDDCRPLQAWSIGHGRAGRGRPDPSGDGVALPLVLANRDSSVCPHADEMRLVRDGPAHRHRPRAAFAAGSPLIAMHLEIVHLTL